MHLKQFERALEAFEHSNSISRHDSTYLHMGKVSVPSLPPQVGTELFFV